MFLSTIICSSFLCLGPLTAATVNLVQNGSFESGIYNASTPDFNTLSQGSTFIEGWTVISDSTYGNIDWVGTYWKAADGIRSIDLNGDTLGLGGGIQQTISTTVGQQYKISFSMSGNPDGGPTLKPMIVLGVGTDLFKVPFYTSGEATTTDMKWNTYEFLFTAGFSSTVLKFISQTSGQFGPVIDNVSVSAVPLPAAAWMLGAGLVGLVAIRRRRNSEINT
jgi:choice-of-anchor C domain-containing protein